MHGGSQRLVTLLAVTLVASTVAHAQDLWVVNGQSRDIAIIDTQTEQVVQTLSLSDPGSPPADPFGIAFARLNPPNVGTYAFVTQGTFIRVIQAPNRTISATINIAPLLPPAATLLTMRGMSAGPPRPFEDALGTTILRSHLFVAADVSTPGGVEPWFLVFDQEILAGLVQGPTPLVSFGAIASAGQGLQVDVVHEPSGSEFESAWFTARETAPPARMHVALIATSRELPADFVATDNRSWTLAAGQQVPLSLGVSSPFASVLPVAYAPTGTSGIGLVGELTNLQAGGSCGPYEDARAILTLGVGPGAHLTALVGSTSTDTGEKLTIVDASTCSESSFPVGLEPHDIVALGRLTWEKLFVLNTGSDTATIVRSDGTTGTVLTGVGPLTGEIHVDDELSCAVPDDLTVTKDGADLQLNWTTHGCGADYKVYCRCLFVSGLSCPPPCGTATSCTECGLELSKGGGGWIPIGPGTGGGEQVHTGAGALSMDIQYGVAPDD